MFTPIVRFALLLLCLVLGIVAAVMGLKYLLFVMAIASLSLLWGYYKLGTVTLALRKLSANDLTAAQAIIDQTTRPERLVKGQRANYYFIKGFLAREKEDFKESSINFNEALKLGLKSAQYKAMSVLALADMALIDGDKPKAQSLFLQLKNLKVHQSLMPQIRQMQGYLFPNGLPENA